MLRTGVGATCQDPFRRICLLTQQQQEIAPDGAQDKFPGSVEGAPNKTSSSIPRGPKRELLPTNAAPMRKKSGWQPPEPPVIPKAQLPVSLKPTKGPHAERCAEASEGQATGPMKVLERQHRRPSIGAPPPPQVPAQQASSQKKFGDTAKLPTARETPITELPLVWGTGKMREARSVGTKKVHLKSS